MQPADALDDEGVARSARFARRRCGRSPAGSISVPASSAARWGESGGPKRYGATSLGRLAAVRDRGEQLVVVTPLARVVVEARDRGLERRHPLAARGERGADRRREDGLADPGVGPGDEDAADGALGRFVEVDRQRARRHLGRERWGADGGGPWRGLRRDRVRLPRPGGNRSPPSPTRRPRGRGRGRVPPCRRSSPRGAARRRGASPSRRCAAATCPRARSAAGSPARRRRARARARRARRAASASPTISGMICVRDSPGSRP